MLIVVKSYKYLSNSNFKASKTRFDWFYLAGIGTGAPTYSQVLPFDPLMVLNHLFIANL